MVMKYVGKVCNKHLDLGGERYRFASGQTICIGCSRDKVARWRSDNQGTIKIINYYRKQAEPKKTAALLARIRRLDIKARSQCQEFVEEWVIAYENARCNMPDLIIRHSFLESTWVGLSRKHSKYTQLQQRTIHAFFRAKFRDDPEFRDSHSAAFAAVNMEAAMLPARGSKKLIADFWRKTEKEIADELFPVVQSDPSEDELKTTRPFKAPERPEHPFSVIPTADFWSHDHA